MFIVNERKTMKKKIHEIRIKKNFKIGENFEKIYDARE